MNIPDEAIKVANNVVSAMTGTPVILAMLLINGAFLGFVTYLMSEISENVQARNKEQMAMITTLVNRECK